MNNLSTTRRNDSASRMSDLQKLVDNWNQNKDLKKQVHLESFDVTVKGTEVLVSDKENCGSKKPKGRAQGVDLPIPDRCPNPLMS